MLVRHCTNTHFVDTAGSTDDALNAEDIARARAIIRDPITEGPIVIVERDKIGNWLREGWIYGSQDPIIWRAYDCSC